VNRLRYREKKKGESRKIYTRESCVPCALCFVSPAYSQLVSGLYIYATIYSVGKVHSNVKW